ncbi:hypothetical protein G6011_06870 [Alternaria panax]|uniref:Uncharacterized protein n=1 Tax=Alternaria panax TaxID=48097 RepID=A0AAD4FDK3_9PLEO|nr:hypothetical protein G6011_06870 [Alternaria panax]
MATRLQCRSDSLQDHNTNLNPFASGEAGSSTRTQQRLPRTKTTAGYKGKCKAADDVSRTPVANKFVSSQWRLTSQRSSTSSSSMTDSDSGQQADLSHLATDVYAAGPCSKSTAGHSSKPTPVLSKSTPIPSKSTPIACFPSPPTTTTTTASKASVVPESGASIPQNTSFAPVSVRGYRLEFETTNRNGFFRSSSFTCTTDRAATTQPAMYPSGASSPRRGNPKRGLNGGGGEVNLHVPSLKVKPVFDVVAQYQGLKLCRVSDAVPYLLGSRHMLTRLAAITEDKLRHTPDMRSARISQDTTHVYSSLDLALMAVLHSLHDTPFTRQATGNWYPQGLPTHSTSLILYNHTALSGPIQTLVSAAKFTDMAETWLVLRNPTNMSGDPPHAINSWVDVSTELRKRGVDMGRIGGEVYYELTTLLKGESLERRIGEIAAQERGNRSGDGDGKEMCGATTQHTVTTAAAEAGGGSEKKGGKTDGINTKRFTHAHPHGYPKSPAIPTSSSDAEKAARAFAVATAAAANTQSKGDGTDKAGGGVIGGVQRGWVNKKRRNAVLFVLFITFVLGPLVGALLWAMGMHKFDWTPGAGEGY